MIILKQFAFAGLCAVVAAGSAQAKDIDQFSLYVGYTAGGSFDNYARPISRHIGKHLPGNPTVIVKYIPGAGSRKLAGYMYEVAKKDGSEIGFLHRSASFDELMLGKKEQYDARKLVYLGSAVRERLVCYAWHEAPFKTIEDVRARPMKIGTTDPSGGDVLVMKLLNKVAGTQFVPVPGYPGGNDLNLAVERREVDGRCQSWISIKASRASWVMEKKLNVLIQASPGKSVDLPGVPSILDIAGNDDDRQAIRLAFAEQEMGNPFVAAPGTPPEIQKMLRTALAQTLVDPAFLAEAQQLKFELEPVSGEEIQQIIESAYGAPKAIIDRTHHLVSD